MDAESTQKVQAILAGGWFLCIFTTTALAIRLWARFVILRTLGYDDILVLAAWLFTMACTICTMVASQYGLGVHMKYVSDPDYVVFLKIQMACSITYSWACATSKASFAVLYMRLLPERWLRFVNIGVCCFVACQATEETLVVILKCKPIALSWTPSLEGTCMTLVPLWWCTFVFNFGTDMTLFLQPIPSMWRLQLPLVKRLGLIFMMSLGLLVTAISIIRMVYVHSMSADVTYDLADSLMWSAAEVSAIIVCSCIPSLRQLAAQIPHLNSALGLSSNKTKSGGGYNRSTGLKSGMSIQLRSQGGRSATASASHHSHSHKPNKPRRNSRFGMVSHAEALGSEEEIFPTRPGDLTRNGSTTNHYNKQKHGGAILVTHEVHHDVESQHDTVIEGQDDDYDDISPHPDDRHPASSEDSSRSSLEKASRGAAAGISHEHKRSS